MAGAFRNLFDDCAAQPACAALAPDGYATLDAMAAHLDRAPEILELYDHDYFDPGTRVRFDGNFLLSSIVDALYDSDWLTYIPLAVGTAAKGDRDALSYFYWDPTMAGEGMAEGMFFDVECREAPVLDSARMAEAAEPFGASGAAAASWSLVPYCARWPVDRAPLVDDGPTVSDIPTLLTSGRYDPVTPPSWAAHAAESLSNSRQLVFRSGGHAVTFWFTCARDAAAAFIADPDPAAVADPTCADYTSPAAFALRF
jgi:pimeloyl-ACP methyl ester carboxylesterase